LRASRELIATEAAAVGTLGRDPFNAAVGGAMPGEPTPEDAGLRQQALLDLHALTHGWTLYQVVRIVESDLQRQIDDEILADHGYHSRGVRAPAPTRTRT
jgi:hypothetical protein